MARKSAAASATAKPDSTAFNAAKTCLPASTAAAFDRVGALNLTQASVKEIASTKESQTVPRREAAAAVEGKTKAASEVEAEA